MEEKCWLVESKGLYFGIYALKLAWVTASKAIRFCREQDARDFATIYAPHSKGHWTITEHSFG